jgi:hypothetical protein
MLRIMTAGWTAVFRMYASDLPSGDQLMPSPMNVFVMRALPASNSAMTSRPRRIGRPQDVM